jgi:replicative DNA helicase
MEEGRGQEIIPPQNIELETSLLSSLIFSGEYDVLDLVKQEHFYRTSHQKIFVACQKVHATEGLIDLKLLASTLGKDIESVGGLSYLGKLSEEPPAPSIEAYASRIVSLYRLRRMIEIANSISKRAYASGEGDADSVLNFSAAEIMKLASGAACGWEPLGSVIQECVENLERIKSTAGITGIPTGFVDFDRQTAGFQAGDLIILAARPGCGKTAFAVNASRNAAAAGFSNAFQSLEMSRMQIGNRFLSSESKLNLLWFRTGLNGGKQWGELSAAAEKLFQLPVYIDDRPKASYHDINRSCRQLKQQMGLDILWVDYLGFVEGDKQSRSKVLEIESITRGLKGLAKELCIPVVLICQLNRECEKRDNKRPMLSDLRDSGALEQDADIVVFLYKDSKYNADTEDKGVVEADIAKHRNGPEKTVRLKWTDDCARFDNLEEREEEGRYGGHRDRG